MIKDNINLYKTPKNHNTFDTERVLMSLLFFMLLVGLLLKKMIGWLFISLQLGVVWEKS